MKKALKVALMTVGVVGISVAVYKIYKEITGDANFIDDFDDDSDSWDDDYDEDVFWEE